MAERFFRGNAFLVGAVALPAVVVGLFLLLTAIPKWTVPPPQYDLLLHTTDYDRPDARVTVELFVRDEALQATVRPAVKDMRPPRVRLWRFDHGTLSAKEIRVDLPTQTAEGEPPRTLVVEALRGRRIVTDTKAPDGYELRTPNHGGPGLIGDLFGMRRYDQSLVIVNRGRVVPIEVPTPNRYETPVFLGWLLDGGNANVDEREQALQQIAAIARAHGLSATEVAAAIDGSSGGAGAPRAQGVLVHVLGVLGGTFVFAGISVFIALQWSDLNSAARVLVTLGSGLAVFVLAVLGTRDRRFDKVATPLFLAAAALEPTGMLVAFEEFGSGGDWRWASLITSGAMAAQFVLTFAALQRSTLLFFAILFGTVFSWTALDLLEVDETVIALVVGASMLLAAVGADRSGRGGITPFWYFAGSSAFLYGFFDAVERTPLEISFLGVAAGFVYGSVLLHSRTLLAVATLAILGYTAWFTGEHFVDSIGWPLALVAFGLVLIGLSALAFRIDRESTVRPTG